MKEIAKHGIPSLVASDVNPTPSFVLKIAARFNVKAFSPAKSLQQKEKALIAPETVNLHERDAIAAAIKCYRGYANRLRQIETLEIEFDKDKLKHLVIEGHALKRAMCMLEKE